MTAPQRWLLWTSSAATGVTGGAYWWMDHLMDPPNEFAVINHPLQPWALKAHILTAPLLIFAVGLIALDHVWRHFRRTAARGRRSGVSTMWIVGPMIFSGYLIQAATSALWVDALGWLHVLTGTLYLAAFGAHQLTVRRGRAQDPTPGRSPAE